MVKGKKRGRVSVKNDCESSKSRKRTELNSKAGNMETVANVNSNHSKMTSQSKRTLNETKLDINTSNKILSKQPSIKSKVVVPEKINFEEDGELVEMEISDGGAAAAEFTSEEEEPNEVMDNTTQSDESESDSSEDESNSSESGEIITQSDEETGVATPEQLDVSETIPVDESPNLHSPRAKKKRKKASSKAILEERLDTISSTLLAMKELMVKNGLVTEEQGKKVKCQGNVDTNLLTSQTTIYRNVLDKQVEKEAIIDEEISFKVKDNDHNLSSSSDERIDTSNEMIEMDVHNVQSFIADCAAEAANSRKRSLDVVEECSHEDEIGPHEDTERMIKEAEASRARILTTPGKYNQVRFNGVTAMQHSSAVDKNYLVIGEHIKPSLRDKIIRGKYVDFARLLPKSRTSEEGRLELINHGGQTYFVPASRNQGTISSFSKWEQAFCVFSNIYT